MDDILITSALFKLAFAFAAVGLLLGTLRLLDRLNGITFGMVLTELMQDRGTALAIYFGSRIVAIALVIGMAIG